MERSREAVWLGLLGGFVAVGCALLGISAAFGAGTKGYSVWTSPPAMVAYAFFVLAAVGLACAVFDVPLPLGKRSRNPLPPTVAAPAETDPGPVARSPSVAEPTPARLEVVRQVGGWIEEQNAIEWLTLPQLAHELWGDPKGGPFDFLRNRRRVAGELAESDPEARKHLAAALRLVPDYSENPSLYGPRERSAVGVLTATIHMLVKVRDLGAESGGVTLMSSTGRVLRPQSLQPLDAWVEYSIMTDEKRRLVVPGTPVDIPVTLRIGCARTIGSKIPLDASHAIAIARVSRAFADFLRGPIEGIGVDALLDEGEQVRTTLELKIRDSANRFTVDELDVDELEHHAAALDEAIDHRSS